MHFLPVSVTEAGTGFGAGSELLPARGRPIPSAPLHTAEREQASEPVPPSCSSRQCGWAEEASASRWRGGSQTPASASLAQRWQGLERERDIGTESSRFLSGCVCLRSLGEQNAEPKKGNDSVGEENEGLHGLLQANDVSHRHCHPWPLRNKQRSKIRTQGCKMVAAPQRGLPAASFLLLRLTAAVAILAACHLFALHLRSSCDLRSQERKGRAWETASANPTRAPARLALRHARLWLPSTGAPGPPRGEGQAMSGSLPSLQGCSTLPPPLVLLLLLLRFWLCPVSAAGKATQRGPFSSCFCEESKHRCRSLAAAGRRGTLPPLFLPPLEEQPQVLSAMRLSWGLLLLTAALAPGGTAAARCPAPCVCDNLRAHVLCLNGNLTAVPGTIPQLTKKLDLRGNIFTVIPVGAFLATPYLTHLDLQRCKVERLEEGAFRGLGRLVYLNLASNSIAILYQESLDGLSSLQQLILEGNRIEEIQTGAFGHLGSLTVLDLRANALVYLPDMVFQGLQVLRWLRLSHNALHVLGSEAFAALPALRRLSLDHNELQALPSEALARLDGVTQLDLGHNPITYVAEEALAMASLKHLFLDHAALQDVAPDAFIRSPQLRMLDLRENQLRGLPPLAGARGLARVSLAGNPLLCSCLLRPFHDWLARARVQVEGVCAAPPALRGRPLDSLRPPEMRCGRPRLPPSPAVPSEQPRAAGSGRCPQGCVCSPDFRHGSCENRDLREIPQGFPGDTRLLDLRRNAFGVVPPAAFPGLKELVSLHLQSCSIGVLHPGALRGLESLVYLYLTDNRLSTLVATAFEGAPRLAYLDLDRNAFARLPAGAFQLLPNLISLHLQHNAIGELAEGDLAGAGGLRWLYLAGNTIGRIAPAALHPAKMLEKLHLEGNRLAEVPTAALRGLSALSELKLSRNPIKHIRDSAFLPVASSLQHLYLDNMGLEQISPGAFTGLGPKIRSLYLESNKMSNIPDMSNFTGLEILNLRDVPFHCDCQLLPLRRWIDKLNLRVGATCGSPAEAQGLKVKLSTTFQTCPGWGRGKAGGASPDKTKAASKPGKKKSLGKSPARGFKKSRA